MSDSTLREAERLELARAVEQLGGSTRPARLLQYLGTRALSAPDKALTEFDIATDVFGRALQNFDPAQDAVVRVEVHRLRKKLKDLYARSETPHGVQISLPAGSYALQFLPATPPAAAVEVEPGRAPRRRRLLAAAVLAAGVFTAIAVMVFPWRDRAPAPIPAQPVSSPARPDQHSEIRLMAGYDGSEVIDSSGGRWTPDRYFSKGGTWGREGHPPRATSRPFLFANWRTGEFGYDLPMAPGVYELRLFFISGQRFGEEKLASFDIALNGKPLQEGYDIYINANGPDVADELVFRDVSPGADGKVRLWFSNRSGSPLLNALELTPGTPGKLKPIRILTQPNSFVDHRGQRWRADDYYTHGLRSSEHRRVSGTEDPELFGAERYGHFSYAIPVDRRGRYTVVLYFVELYHGPQQPAGGGVGSRIFQVFCNGQTLLRDFDIYREAGSLRVVRKSFSGIAPTAQGKINLQFVPVVNNATVSGMEVIEE